MKRKIVLVTIILLILLIFVYYKNRVTVSNENKLIKLIEEHTNSRHVKILDSKVDRNHLFILYTNEGSNENSLYILEQDSIFKSLYRIKSGQYSCIEKDIGTCFLIDYKHNLLIVYGTNTGNKYTKYVLHNGKTEYDVFISNEKYIIDVYIVDESPFDGSRLKLYK